MALLDPPRFARLVPFAANVAASPWIIAWNHVARQALLATGGTRGLALARQIAHATYRAPQGLQQRQGRTMFTGDPHRTWSSKAPYDVQTYLEHQGRKLTERYTPGAYLCALDAMDHHDARRPPPGHRGSWTLDRVEAAALVVTINSDCLFTHDDGDALAGALLAERHVIDSPHGHDAFLIEWEQVRSALTRAWELEDRTPTR
jgi:homoserine O-acetyltransferase